MTHNNTRVCYRDWGNTFDKPRYNDENPGYYRYEISRKSMDKTDAYVIYIEGVTRMG